MKNIDKIRQMSAEELAKLISNHSSCDFCTSKKENCIDDNCESRILEWLNQDTNPMPELERGDIVETRYYTLVALNNVLVRSATKERMVLDDVGEIERIWRFSIDTGEYEVIWRG